MYSLGKKQEAIDLRRKGYAFSYISKQIDVSQSTLSLWLTDIVFKPNQFTKNSIAKGHKHNSVLNREDKALSLQRAEHYAEQYKGNLSDRELFFLGIGIYIGEGSKSGHITRVVKDLGILLHRKIIASIDRVLGNSHMRD